MSKRVKSVNFFEKAAKSIAVIAGLTVIKDVVIVQSGIDKVGDYMDNGFIDGIVKQGNDASTGIKCRGGHPNMCKDSLGTYIGDFHNFRAIDHEGKYKAVADLYIADIAKKTMIDGKSISYHDYVVEMAKNHPDKFGNSIVFMADEEWVEVEGKQIPKLTLTQFIASDIVDSPAATDGLFKSDEDLGIKLTEFLDDNPELFTALEKNTSAIEIFLKKYQSHLKSKNIDMNLKKLFQKTFGTEQKDFTTTDANGTILTVVTEANEAKVGDEVTIDGTPAPDAEYVFPDGSKWKITGGKIETITPADAQPAQTPQDTTQQLSEQVKTLEVLQKSIQEKVDKLMSSIGDLQKSQEDNAKQIDFIMEHTSSDFTPEVPKNDKRQPDGTKAKRTVADFLKK